MADKEGLKPFDLSLEEAGLYPLRAFGMKVLQVNMGNLCNLACRHCHVGAGPSGKDVMPPQVLSSCLDVIRRGVFPIVDITGGAPELNPGYRGFLEACATAGVHVKTRTNLAILLEEGHSDLPALFAARRVEVIASLPYYTADTSDRQRGKGTFAASIEALKALNAIGYGIEGTGLFLNLVYNPCGAYLPAPQKSIEKDFRNGLEKRYGIRFSNLFTLNNMPLGRFLEFLQGSGNYERYMARLVASFNPMAARGVMCRDTVSVGWDGRLYDCDFNQMAGIACGEALNIFDFRAERLTSRRISTADHCYGCTAGAGSSCTGSLA